MFRSVSAQAEGLEQLAERLLNGDVVLRTMLRTGPSFKRDVAKQTNSDDILRQIRYARLPHWVWVVEAHDKEHCENGPCVVAAAVFDSTSYDLTPPLDVLSLPGIVAVYPPDAGAAVIGDGSPDPWHSVLPVH